MARSRTELSPEFTYNSRNWRFRVSYLLLVGLDTKRFRELWEDSKKFSTYCQVIFRPPDFAHSDDARMGPLFHFSQTEILLVAGPPSTKHRH